MVMGSADCQTPRLPFYKQIAPLRESCILLKSMAAEKPDKVLSPRTQRSALQQRRRLGANLQLDLVKRQSSLSSHKDFSLSPGARSEAEVGSPWSLSSRFSPRDNDMTASTDTGPPDWSAEDAGWQERRRASSDLPQLQLNLQTVPDEERMFFCQDQAVCIAEKYELLKALGQGTTGVVYAARRKEDGRQVALKTMRTMDEEMMRIAHQEYALLSSIRHPHIIEALDFFAATDRTVVVLEYFDGHTLDKTVSTASGRRLSESVAHTLFLALMQAVAHLHQHRIIHRDVKAQNVLVAHNFKDLRLIDFNTARRLSDGALTMTGTQLYSAPEVLLGESPSEGSDVWSSGLCLYIMLCGRLPPLMYRFKGCFSEFREAVSSQPVVVSGRRWQHVSQPCKATLLRCLEIRKLDRPTATQILEDSWMRHGAKHRNCLSGVHFGRRASEPPSARLRRKRDKSPRRAKSLPPTHGTQRRVDVGRRATDQPLESLLRSS